MDARTQFETALNDFDPARRRDALQRLIDLMESGAIEIPAAGPFFNLHAHSFFSYNGYGYSPSCLAWKGKAEGLCGMGLVDFDVLDGVDEFLEACRRLELRMCAGFETRIFVPEFGTRVMNSPGEPGVSYHVGVGFTSTQTSGAEMITRLKDIAQARNRRMVDRINAHLAPVMLDYDADVLPLTPNGNATERHVCTAYDTKAQQVFPDPEARAAFWAGKLTTDHAAIKRILDDGPAFQGLIRAKTMKAGGAGYVRPEGPDFPRIEEVNAFILANGAIPSYAWVDGTSEGEAAIEELLDVMQASGVAILTVIPERNWNFKDPEVRKLKVANLYDFVGRAQARHLPIVVGTEMNAYGQRFVDAFETPELEPLYPIFRQGANIIHAHTLLQAHAGMGYLSPWADANFSAVREKNRFYETLGERCVTASPAAFAAINPSRSAQELSAALGLDIGRDPQ